jgi:hypothetical protein
MLVASTVVVGGCGGATFANRPRPAAAVNLSVYVDNARVSVAPRSVGAGPVLFIVTNQADTTESVTIRAVHGGRALATTGPINPQATAQVTVDLRTPGAYAVVTEQPGHSEAAQFTAPPIQPATIHVGAPRPSASNELLQP